MSEVKALHGADKTYRPKGGWCATCLKRMAGADCGGVGTMIVGRVRRYGKVHVARVGRDYLRPLQIEPFPRTLCGGTTLRVY